MSVHPITSVALFRSLSCMLVVCCLENYLNTGESEQVDAWREETSSRKGTSCWGFLLLDDPSPISLISMFFPRNHLRSNKKRDVLLKIVNSTHFFWTTHSLRRWSICDKNSYLVQGMVGVGRFCSIPFIVHLSVYNLTPKHFLKDFNLSKLWS